jgi:hypothetical protein
MLESSAVKASNPPADAPTPTIGNLSLRRSPSEGDAEVLESFAGITLERVEPLVTEVVCNEFGVLRGFFRLFVNLFSPDPKVDRNRINNYLYCKRYARGESLTPKAS